MGALELVFIFPIYTGPPVAGQASSALNLSLFSRADLLQPHSPVRCKGIYGHLLLNPAGGGGHYLPPFVFLQ